MKNINEEYIEEDEWFKCEIDGIIYHCFLTYGCHILISKPWVNVTVRKYITKKLWLITWEEEEFECYNYPDISPEKIRVINDAFYFKSEYIKGWVKGALNARENKILQKKFQKEQQKNIKIITEL